MAKITQEIAQKIIDLCVEGHDSLEIRKKIGVGLTSVNEIIRGRRWEQCTRPQNILEVIERKREKGRFKKASELYRDYPRPSEIQSDILIGSLLGDGHLRRTCSNHPNSCFVKEQCKKYKSYVQWHHDELKPFSISIDKQFRKRKLVNKNGIVGRIKATRHLSGYVIRTCSHPFFTELRNKWYPDGKKVIPEDLALSPLSLAVWFCDDGHNCYQGRCATICCQSFSPKEAELLCLKLAAFDMKPIMRINKKKQPFLKIYSTSYDNLIQTITPYIPWKCMSHKIKYRETMIGGAKPRKDIPEIFKMSKNHQVRVIAEKFGVHPKTISSVLNGRSWVA